MPISANRLFLLVVEESADVESKECEGDRALLDDGVFSDVCELSSAEVLETFDSVLLKNPKSAFRC